MTIQRLATHPGLLAGPGFTEVAYHTGHADPALSTARVRITPLLAEGGPRLHQPNTPALPPKVDVRLSASLVDAEGQVIRIGGRLLLGEETTRSYQFETDAPFDPVAWLDSEVATLIPPLLRQARDMMIAYTAGLLPPLPEPAPEEPAGE